MKALCMMTLPHHHERLSLCSPAIYRITVQGRLDAGRAAWFEVLDLNVVGEHTILRACMADQTALHGLLSRVRDLGLPLIEVCWLATETDR